MSYYKPVWSAIDFEYTGRTKMSGFIFKRELRECRVTEFDTNSPHMEERVVIKWITA